MGNIFISYRREDSQFITDRIFDHLARHFSRKSLFKDVDNIPVGVDFRAHIEVAMQKCSVMLAIIGPDWVNATNPAGQRRLDQPADPVRVELSSALQLGRTIIPVLVGGASMPTADELPQALTPITFINAVQVRSDPDFATDFNRLRRALAPLVGPARPRWTYFLVAGAVVLAVVIALSWLQVPRPLLLSLPNFGTLPDHPPVAVPPTAPATSPPQGCIDIPFNDTTKFPPVTTTKRICK